MTLILTPEQCTTAATALEKLAGNAPADEDRRIQQLAGRFRDEAEHAQQRKDDAIVRLRGNPIQGEKRP